MDLIDNSRPRAIGILALRRRRERRRQGNILVTIHGDGGLVRVSGCGYPPDDDGQWQADLVAPGGARMRVYASCEYDGSWSVAAARAGDEPFPPWPVTVRAAACGEPALRVRAPRGTRMDGIFPAVPE